MKSIYPVRLVAIRKSQLLQEGVVASDGMTLDEVHAQEERQAAEMKAKKAAALAAAMAEEADELADEVDDEADDDEPETAEETSADADVEEAPAKTSSAPDYDSMTVAELKELLKAAGKPVSGKKADLVARLNE